MIAAELSQLLMLYTWFALAVLLFFLLLIARFYEKLPAEKTHFRLFAIPAACFGIATVRYASIDQMAGDLFGDIFMGIAGIVLIFLLYSLYRKMVAGHVPTRPIDPPDVP